MPASLEAGLIFLALVVGLGTLVRLGYGISSDNLPPDFEQEPSHPHIYLRSLALVPLTLVLSMLLMSAFSASADPDPIRLLLTAILIQLPLQLVILLNLNHLVRLAGYFPAEFLQLEPRQALPAFTRSLYLILPVAIMIMVFSLIWQMFLIRCGYTPEPQELVTLLPKLGFSPELVAILLIAVVFAPVYEEIIFRRLLMPYLVPSLGLNGAIVISSLAFGLIHFNLGAAVPLTLLGMTFCWVYLKTRSLWSAVFLHALFNLTTIVMQLANVDV